MACQTSNISFKSSGMLSRRKIGSESLEIIAGPRLKVESEVRFEIQNGAIPKLYGIDLDPTKARIAFGTWALPILKDQLDTSDVDIQRKAVSALDDVLHDPEKVATAIKEDIIDSLFHLLESPDALVRERAMSCLLTISNLSIGSDEIVRLEGMSKIARLFEDPEPSVRLRAHDCFVSMTRLDDGIEHVISEKLVPILLKLLKTEDDQIKPLILQTLHHVCEIDPLPALTSRGMKVMRDLLIHPKSKVRKGAASCLADMTAHTVGKQIADSSDLLCDVLPKLADENCDVVAQAAATTMFSTLTTPGRLKAVELEATDLILSLLKVEHHKTVQINAVKILTNLAEVPKARQYLLENHLDMLEKFCTDCTELLERAVKRLIEVVKWKP